MAQDICVANDIPLLPVFMSYFKINSISPFNHDFLGNVTYDKYFQFVVLFTFLDVLNIMHGINWFYNTQIVLFSVVGIQNDNNISVTQVEVFLKGVNCEHDYIIELFDDKHMNEDKTVNYSIFVEWLQEYYPNIIVELGNIRKKIIKNNLGKYTVEIMKNRIDNISVIELYRSLHDQNFPMSCGEKICKLFNHKKRCLSEYDFIRPIDLHLSNIISEMRRCYGFGNGSQIQRAVKSYLFSCEKSHNRVIGHSLSILSSSFRPSKSYKIVPYILSNESNI